MRIISLVPSWTETLMESGLCPVGRTRFCVHPAGAVEKIPIVGGTKTVNWEMIKELKPDLLILDQEENPKEFSEQGIPYWTSHVTDGVKLEEGLQQLAKLFKNKPLQKMAILAAQINRAPSATLSIENEALIEIINPWMDLDPQKLQVAYIIWKKPWMSVSQNTYIAFVLKKLGYKVYEWPDTSNKYPVVTIREKKDLIYFFSSEPYPFSRETTELKKLNIQCALVDGEKFSWFGIRSLRFLQKALQLSDPE